jgi:hypothetical protein
MGDDHMVKEGGARAISPLPEDMQSIKADITDLLSTMIEQVEQQATQQQAASPSDQPDMDDLTGGEAANGNNTTEAGVVQVGEEEPQMAAGDLDTPQQHEAGQHEPSSSGDVQDVAVTDDVTDVSDKPDIFSLTGGEAAIDNITEAGVVQVGEEEPQMAAGDLDTPQQHEAGQHEPSSSGAVQEVDVTELSGKPDTDKPEGNTEPTEVSDDRPKTSHFNMPECTCMSLDPTNPDNARPPLQRAPKLPSCYLLIAPCPPRVCVLIGRVGRVYFRVCGPGLPLHGGDPPVRD